MEKTSDRCCQLRGNSQIQYLFKFFTQYTIFCWKTSFESSPLVSSVVFTSFPLDSSVVFTSSPLVSSVVFTSCVPCGPKGLLRRYARVVVQIFFTKINFALQVWGGHANALFPTRLECSSQSSPLVWSVVLSLFNSFRVRLLNFSTRFECSFKTG